jgi:spore germination protein GerM
VLTAVAAAVLAVCFSVAPVPAAGESGGAHAANAVAPGSAAENVVHLYFTDRRGPFLHAQERVFSRPADPLAFGREILTMLIRGPRGELGRTLPVESEVRAFFIDDGTAVVDFTDAIREQHPGGCRTELLTIFSIVNSLVLNMDGVESVRILIDGREPDTLAGHIDLHPAYAADMLLVR